MTKTNQDKNGILGILIRTRRYNIEVGNYLEHFLTQNFEYAVKLSNGRITVPPTMAQDQEVQPSSISEERIKKVASTFSH